MICIEATKADKELLKEATLPAYVDHNLGDFHLTLEGTDIHWYSNEAIMSSDIFVSLQEFKELWYERKLMELL